MDHDVHLGGVTGGPFYLIVDMGKNTAFLLRQSQIQFLSEIVQPEKAKGKES